MQIHVLNGVNLGGLGTRRPEVYGSVTLKDIEAAIREGYPAVDFFFRQTDYEGEMVGYIAQAGGVDGVIVNPGAWTHYSYALHDALEAIQCVKVEVHISNVHAREEWRRKSVISPSVDAVVAGMGTYGYRAAVSYIMEWHRAG